MASGPNPLIQPMPDWMRRNGLTSDTDWQAAAANHGDTPDQTRRAGAGYDAFTQQSANPYAVQNPDGSITPAGGPLDQAPQWNQNTGPYGAYLNRLNTNTAAPDALAGQTRAGIADQIRNSGIDRQNAALAAAQGNSDQTRGMQLAAAGNLATAGGDFRNAQGGLLAGGMSAAAADSMRQSQLAAGAGRSDAGSAGYQNSALGMYQAAAMGQGPSAAQAQFQGALDQNIAAQRAMGASARGGGAAAAMRQAGQTGAQLALQSQAQSAALRAAEQQAGMAGLANTAAAARAGDVQRYGMGADILAGKRYGDTASMSAGGQIAGQARGQDIGQAGAAADYLGGIRGQDIAAGGTFGGLENQTAALNDARRNAALGLGLTAEQQRQAALNAQNQTNLAAAGLMSSHYLQGRQMGLQHAEARRAQDFALGGSIANGGAGLLQAGLGGGFGGGGAGYGYGYGGGGIGPSVDAALASFDNAHQQPGMF